MSDGPAIFAVSDATGETAEQVCRAALAQFDVRPEEYRLRTFPHVRNRESVRAVLDLARRDGALVLYTLVGSEQREAMRQLAAEAEVHAVDLIGGLIRDLSVHLQRAPLHRAGLGHETDEAYFQRIEAVEFAVKHDDGRNPSNLRKADIVFVGLSRTSKTPLSNYVAQRGYKVANVPLVMNVPVPKQLEEVDPRRVFGLVIDPGVLSNIRRTRMETLGMNSDSEYGDLQQIRQELRWVRELYERHPDWTVIDITRKAIEETASLVLEMYRQRFENGGGTAATSPARGSAG